MSCSLQHNGFAAIVCAALTIMSSGCVAQSRDDCSLCKERVSIQVDADGTIVVTENDCGEICTTPSTYTFDPALPQQPGDAALLQAIQSFIDQGGR